MWQSACVKLVSGALKPPEPGAVAHMSLHQNQQCQRTHRQNEADSYRSPSFGSGDWLSVRCWRPGQSGGRNRLRRPGERAYMDGSESGQRLFALLFQNPEKWRKSAVLGLCITAVRPRPTRQHRGQTAFYGVVPAPALPAMKRHSPPPMRALLLYVQRSIWRDSPPEFSPPCDSIAIRQTRFRARHHGACQVDHHRHLFRH